MAERLVNVNQALELLSLSRTEFYRQVNAGKIPLLKLGRASRVRLSDCENWIASLEQKAVA